MEGLPNLQALGKLFIGEKPEEMLSCDQRFQLEHIGLVREAIDQCEALQDYVSRDLLIDNLEYEEEYLDHLDTQKQQIDDMGLALYLQAQV